MNRLELSTLFLAEITRLKFGKNGMSLTNPKIEKAARHRFAALVGIKPNSDPKTYLQAIKLVYIDNKLENEFNARLLKFNVTL